MQVFFKKIENVFQLVLCGVFLLFVNDLKILFALKFMRSVTIDNSFIDTKINIDNSLGNLFKVRLIEDIELLDLYINFFIEVKNKESSFFCQDMNLLLFFVVGNMGNAYKRVRVCESFEDILNSLNIEWIEHLFIINDSKGIKSLDFYDGITLLCIGRNEDSILCDSIGLALSFKDKYLWR